MLMAPINARIFMNTFLSIEEKKLIFLNDVHEVIGNYRRDNVA